MEKTVTINEEKINRILAQKIAEYWNGREIEVSGGVGSQWSDWEGEINEEDGTWKNRKRVQGTHDRVQAIIGTIHATANGSTVVFNITYNIQIANVG